LPKFIRTDLHDLPVDLHDGFRRYYWIKIQRKLRFTIISESDTLLCDLHDLPGITHIKCITFRDNRESQFSLNFYPISSKTVVREERKFLALQSA